MSAAARLDAAIRAVCPIVGVSVGSWTDRATWRVDFAPEATAAERTAASAPIQPGVFTFGPLMRSSTRCVIDVPVRGVRVTSSSGGGASPCAIAASVAAVRDVLPRTIW